MKKIFSLALLAIFLACLPLNLLAQDEYPVIVSFPQLSVSVFTNWQLVKLTYTVGYLDGYRVNFEEARPENMMFGLEIDQEKGSKLIRLNKRKYKKENYEDLVYYVRHIGEKKGEVTIPEQTFRYIKEEPGRSSEGQLVHEAKAPAAVLRYDSTLTKNADDIMDVVDFGSFQKQEKIWKGLAMGAVALSMLSVFLIFYWPAVIIRIRKKSKVLIEESKEQAKQADTSILTPQEAVKEFKKDLQIRQNSFRNLANISTDICIVLDREERVRLANDLKGLLQVYWPAILASDTPHEIELKVENISTADRNKKSLVNLAKQLVYLDNLLYGQKALQDLSADLRDALLVCRDLERADSWWELLKFRARNFWLGSKK